MEIIFALRRNSIGVHKNCIRGEKLFRDGGKFYIPGPGLIRVSKI